MGQHWWLIMMWQLILTDFSIWKEITLKFQNFLLFITRFFSSLLTSQNKIQNMQLAYALFFLFLRKKDAVIFNWSLTICLKYEMHFFMQRFSSWLKNAWTIHGWHRAMFKVLRWESGSSTSTKVILGLTLVHIQRNWKPRNRL